MLPLHGLHFGLRISVIYPNLVSYPQTLKKTVPGAQCAAPSSLDSIGDECPSKKDLAFVGPILH